MNKLTLVSLLDWLYQDYSIIFLLCLLGSFTHDIYDTAKNNTKINVKSIISSSLICSILLSVVIDHLNKYSIDVKIAICFSKQDPVEKQDSLEEKQEREEKRHVLQDTAV